MYPNLVRVWNGRTEGAGGFYAKSLDRYLVRTFIVGFLGVSSVTSDDVTGLRIYVLQRHASRQPSFGVANSLI